MIEKRRSHGRRLLVVMVLVKVRSAAGQAAGGRAGGAAERRLDCSAPTRPGRSHPAHTKKRHLVVVIFDSSVTMLPHGSSGGQEALGWVHPMPGSCPQIVDLAKARLGIRVPELAELLNLQIELARSLVVRAAERDGADLNSD